MRWPVWVAFIGGLLLGYILGRLRGNKDHLDIDSKERKQMWIREGKL
jgi:hypothetical protein